MRNVLLTGGVGHPFASTSVELAALFAARGVTTTIVDSDQWEEALAGLGAADVLTVNALRWRMLADRYDELRSTHAYTTTLRLRAAIEAHLAAGRPILAMHTSCICFDDWPRWGEILGGVWDWDRSFHPLLDEIRLSWLGAEGKASADSAFLQDEVYHGLRVEDPDRRVVAWANVPPGSTAQNEPPLGAFGIGDPQPVIWTRIEGTARIAVDTLAHDVRSLTNPAHRSLLENVVTWLLNDER